MTRLTLSSLFVLFFFSACSSPNQKTVSLRIGEAVNFSTGTVSKEKSKGDMVFMYQPPQSPHGWRYNPTNGQIEYQAQVGTTENYPLLSAAKTGAFKTKPDISKMTSGDINQWTEDEYDIGPGRYILVRGLTDGKHWLVKTTKLTAKSNDPKTWLISFTYEPINLPAGAAGSAGKNMNLPGVLTFRERLHTEKIISLDLSNGTVKELFDGYGVTRNPLGEYVYVNTAFRIVLADKTGKQIAVFDQPATDNSLNTYSNRGPSETVISPNGKYIAVGVSRRQNYTNGGITVPGLPEPTIAIVDRAGKEITSYYSAKYASWTPDGRLLMADPSKPGIFITDASLKNLKPIPGIPDGHIEGIALSPDGKTLAFSLNYRIWMINIDGTGLHQLTQSGQSEVTPVWSPDGKYLAFQQSIKDKKEFFNIVVVRVIDDRAQLVTDQLGNNREPNGTFSWN